MNLMLMCLPKVLNKNTSKKTYFFLASCQPPVEKNQDPDPEVSGTDPRIRTRTEMSRIHSTALKIDRTSVIFVQHVYLNKRKNCVMKEKRKPHLFLPSQACNMKGGVSLGK
jgi:hypothetical protein